MIHDKFDSWCISEIPTYTSISPAESVLHDNNNCSPFFQRTHSVDSWHTHRKDEENKTFRECS